ncbi:pantoate--beta-alanine ligase [candidate division KSB1 bacterium]
MKIFTSISEMQKQGLFLKAMREKTGFVPTMGFLHEGHLSLIKQAKKECSSVVVSIFVNPTQFSPDEDLESYPRNMQKDKKMLRYLDVDYLFLPSAEKIYKEPFLTSVSVTGITEVGEGVSRPTHFKGVTTVVTKLLNIIQPNILYLGQKDIQQAVIIDKMTKDLNIPVKVEICDTLREKDGLAMSSRNVYLTEDQRKSATALIRALRKAESLVNTGKKDTKIIEREMKKELDKYPDIRPDYILFADKYAFQPVKKITNETVIAIAGFAGKVRLIDNIIVKP